MKKSKMPVCSHCGYEFDDQELWEGEYTVGKVHTGDCDESTLTCPNTDCGKQFFTCCVHEYRFIQIDEDGQEI